jgi:hypothetical protein
MEKKVNKNIKVCHNGIKPKEKPINIYFDSLHGESGMTLNPEIYYQATINVNIRIDKSVCQKYIKKKLTIKDLNDIIKCRK